MKPGTKAFLAEEGGKLLSSAIKMAMVRPRRSTTPESTTEEPEVLPPGKEMIEIQLDREEKAIIPEKTPPRPEPAPTVSPHITPTMQEELDYRWECCMKHLGGASVLLRECYERAIDEGIGEGTAEKIMEAMNEHAGMEVDLEKMLPIHEATEQAEKLLSGIRAFRKAAWEAKLPTGGGTKEDVADARLWNDILYTEAFNSAKQQPGEACIEEGM